MMDVTETEEDDMTQTWACLACSSTFRFGQIRMRAGALACPHCDAADGPHPAGGEVHELKEYHGPVGTLN